MVSFEIMVFSFDDWINEPMKKLSLRTRVFTSGDYKTRDNHGRHCGVRPSRG